MFHLKYSCDEIIGSCFFFSSPERNLILQLLLWGCFRTVTRYTGQSVAVLTQIGSDAEQHYPDPDCASICLVRA